ncbi:MAG: DUF465 domain-containing protein [Xanthomonadaceae bacterium]|jgi:hypothetical protein|nr:DUF465 domain-containing protein [Xanthomonadaceae bacterium]
MPNLTPSEITQRIAALRLEHRALDIEIAGAAARSRDELHVKRLKKRRLWLKDCIARLEDMQIPDEPA